MPIYEFRCKECGGMSEFRVSSYSASQTPVCSSCGSHDMERLISAPNLLRVEAKSPGTTCCGREERCEAPPCSTDEGCRRL
jgi:putative FmdB family regulatory protein